MSDEPDNVVSSKYYNINEIQSLKVSNKKGPLYVSYQCLFFK